MDNISEKELAAAVRQIAYRKAYSRLPQVRAARKQYNKRRQAAIKLALQEYRAKQASTGTQKRGVE